MPTPVGGLRDRLIHESLFRLVRDCLVDELGWNDAGRVNAPLNIIASTVDPSVDPHEVVPLNTLSVAAEDTSGEGLEMGSNATEDRHPCWIDFYAENDDIGAHVIGDVREILRGRIAGRTGPVLDVWDYDQATPVVLFSCVLEEVTTDRAHGFTQAHQAHWYACHVVVVDEVD